MSLVRPYGLKANTAWPPNASVPPFTTRRDVAVPGVLTAVYPMRRLPAKNASPPLTSKSELLMLCVLVAPVP